MSAERRPRHCPPLMSPDWQARLKDGVRARVIASVELDETTLPVELLVRAGLDDDGELSVFLATPESGDGGAAQEDALPALTPRERAVIGVVALGKSSEEIAEVLGISPATVRTHVRNAMAKVGAHTRAQLIAIVLGDPRHARARDPATAREA